MFFVSDDGKVIKAINTKSADSYEEVEPLIIEEIVVFPSSVVISSLRIVVSQQRKRIVVVSSSSLVSISLHRCGTKKITTCRYIISFKMFFL